MGHGSIQVINGVQVGWNGNGSWLSVDLGEPMLINRWLVARIYEFQLYYDSPIFAVGNFDLSCIDTSILSINFLALFGFLRLNAM